MKKLAIITTLLITTSCASNNAQLIDVEKSITPEQFLKSDDLLLSSVENFWKSPFENKELEAIVNLALTNNYSLKIAWHNLEKSESLFNITNSDRLPDINLETSSSATRTKVSDGEDSRSSSNAMGLAMSWELDLWGRLKNLSNADYLEFEATAQDVQATYLLIVSSVIENYLLLAEAEKDHELLNNISKLRSDQYILNQELYKFGSISSNILNDSKSSYKKAEYEVLQSKNNISDLKYKLATILGINTKDLSEISYIKYNNLNTFGNVDLMKTRPDLIASGKRVRSSIEKTKAAKLERLPSLKVNLGYGFDGSSVSNMYKSTVFNSLIGLNIPVFRAGEITQNINIAKSDQEIKTLEFLELSNNAINEVSKSVTNLKNEEDSLKLSKVSLGLIKDNFSIDKSLYYVGSIEYSLLIDSELKLLEQQQNYNTANTLYLQSILNMYRSVGGMTFQNNKEEIKNEV